MNNKDLKDIIHRIPKTDLHCHLDGSIRLETILNIAKKENLPLPAETVEGLNESVFKDQYANLEEYLKTFEVSCTVLQKPEYLERIACELAEDAQAEGVRYLEIRFAPQLHINDNMDMRTVLESVNKGLRKAKHDFNMRDEVQNGSEPKFHYGIIVCALRSFGDISDYYTNFINAHTFSNPKTIYGLGSLELAKGAVKIRDELDLPIVGFDLAGAEHGNPARDHWQAFQYVHENFMKKTVHAGEAYGAPSIFQAITELHADRIGHGYYLFDTSKIEDKSITDRERYVRELAQYIADRRITIEVCLTSNMQTNPSIGEIKNHAFSKMLSYGLSVTLCTDNRTVSKTTISKEIMLALENFGISPHRLKNLIIYGFKRSFFPGPYLKKREYVRQCINYYEQIVAGSELDDTQ